LCLGMYFHHQNLLILNIHFKTFIASMGLWLDRSLSLEGTQDCVPEQLISFASGNNRCLLHLLLIKGCFPRVKIIFFLQGYIVIYLTARNFKRINGFW
jgi:hypothetical protein